MKFTNALQMAQARPQFPGSLALFLFVGCSGSPTPGLASPEQGDPRGTIDLFMSAVNREDIATMSRLWGTKDGPVASKMDPVVAERRLRLMQIYLKHDSYEVQIAEGELLSRNTSGAKYQVRLLRRNCTPLIPFTLVQSGSGWLIENVDLAQAGNPQRSCRPGTRPTTGAFPTR